MNLINHFNNIIKVLFWLPTLPLAPISAAVFMLVDQSFEHLQPVQKVILVKVVKPEVVEVALLLCHVLHVKVSEPLLELLAEVGLLLLNALLICPLGPK